MDDWRERAKNSLNVRNYLPAIKRFKGDAKLAAACLPLAQTILGDVINRASLGGIEVGHRIVKLADGTIIRAIVNGDIRTIEIETGKPDITSFLAGKSGFVFYPQIAYDPIGSNAGYYGRPDENATLRINYGADRSSPRVIVNAPIAFTPHGNQFVFLDKDVYSWKQNYNGGDGPGFIGLPWIWKNNILWQYLAYPNYPGVSGIYGLRLFHYTRSDDTVETRMLLGAGQGTKGLQIRCYVVSGDNLQQIGEAYSLREDPSITYSSRRWPIRFNSTGTQASVIASYSKRVTYNGVPTYEEIYEIVTATIEHYDDDFAVNISVEIAGSYLQKIDKSSFKNSYNHNIYLDAVNIEDINSPVCLDRNINFAGSYSKEQTITETITCLWEQRYPIALNYIADNLVVYYYYYSWDLGRDYYWHLLNQGEATVVDEWQEIDGFCRETINKLITYTGTQQEEYLDTQKNIETYKINDITIFESDQSSVWNNAYSHEYLHEQNGGGWGQPPYTPQSFGSRTDALDIIWKSKGQTAFDLYYVNVSDNIILAAAARSSIFRNTNGTRITNYSGSYTSSFDGENIYGVKYEGHFPFHFSGDIREIPVRVIEIYYDPYPVSYATVAGPGQVFKYESQTIYGQTGFDITRDETTMYGVLIDPPIKDINNNYITFSYANDERVTPPNKAWMYSLKCNPIADEGTFYEARCTAGPVGNFLPAVYNPGIYSDNIPTGENITDGTLLLHPIALF